VAEQAGSVYAEIRLQLDKLSRDVNSAKNKFASLDKDPPSPEVRLAMNNLGKDIVEAKKRLRELDKLKVHPPEVKLELDKLDADIATAKKHLKELKSVDAPPLEVKLAMEKLEDDVRLAKEKKAELNKAKIYPPEVRLEVEKLQGDIAQAKAKFDDLQDGATNSFNGINGRLGTLGQKVNGHFQRMGKSGVAGFTKLFKGIQKAILKAPVVGAILLIIGLIKKLVSGVQKMINRFNEWLDKGLAAYQAHNMELARMEAVLNATGQAAWTSTRQLAAAAEELAKNSTFAQNEIMKMQTTLMTFGTVVGETFDRAQVAIADMASAMGGNLDSAARSVGRALADPANATRVLQREGVILSQAQKELIDNFIATGDKAAAQNVILEEMESRFGGAAAAMGEVGAAQNRLAMAQERLTRAQGEATAGFSSFRDNMRAARYELRASAYETMLAAAAARQRQRDGYSAQMEELARLRQAIRDAGDDWEQVAALEDREARLTVELEIQEAEDRLARLSRGFGGIRTLVEDVHDNIRDGIGRAAGAVIEGHRKMWGQVGSAINGVRERVSGWVSNLAESVPVIGRVTDASNRLLDATVRRRRLQREAAEEQRGQAQEELERIQARAAADAMYAAQQEQELQKIAELTARLEEIEQQRVRTLEEVRLAYAAGIITAEELHNRKTAAYQNEANAIIRLQSLMQGLEFNTRAAAEAFGTLGTRAEGALAGAAAQTRTLQAQQAARTQAVEGFTTAAQRLYNDMNRELSRLEANRLREVGKNRGNEEAINERFEALMHSRRTQTLRDMEQNFERHNMILGQTGALNATAWRDRVHAAVYGMNAEIEARQHLQAELERLAGAEERIRSRESELLHEQAIANARLVGDLQEVRRLEEARLIYAMRQSDEFQDLYHSEIEGHREMAESIIAQQMELNRTLRAVEASEMLSDYQNKMAQLNMTTRQSIEAQRDHARALAYTMAMGDPELYRDLIAAIDEYYERLRRKDAFQSFVSNTRKYMNEALGIVNAFADVFVENQRRRTAEYVAQLGEQHRARREHYDRQLQETLFHLGLVAAATQRQFADELQTAIATGNHRLIHQAHMSMKRFEAEEKFREKQEAAEAEYNRRKAQAEYEMAMVEWRIRKAMGAASVAQSVIMAGMNTWPLPAIPMMAMAGAKGAAQMIAINQARPQKNFSTGGIVPGNSLSGDRIIAGLNSREMVLTTGQQKNLFDRINGDDLGGGNENGDICVDVTLYMDTDVVAKKVFKVGSRGNHFMRSRGVVR